MAIREDLVASAATFLQDPSVAASPIEKKIAFLQAKNLTQEEVNAALARFSPGAPPPQAYPSQAVVPAAQQAPPSQQYYGQQQYPPQQYPPYGWQPPSQTVPPRRDWRDWFIMATVVSGVSYGLFSLGKRYVYPLIAPPTPDRLEQDKKAIDEQFEKTFALVEQLAKDTEALKAAETERTEKLDSTLGELETVIGDLKSANRRRDDEAQRVRDDVQNLKDSIPRALNNQKDLTDTRLREVNAELKSLKTLITQRMNPTATSTSVNNYLRPSATTNGTPTASPAATPAPAAETSNSAENKDEPKTTTYQDYLSNTNRTASPFSSGMAAKASIPAWQMMASNKSAAAASSSAPAANGGEAAGSGSSSTDTPGASS
ncbi:peroxisomal membrane anchor protein conserved region-domain-containing protein [Triangularia verruculosa]|uniref:Peroxisomal membrane protein PEX14 n=1 Tax=Triangularia verruculosa TaxID=2587418 RepID=A0AAN6XL33_9PEZI|nr:peroxisomal membrane anchor protein conserved region-domain-containing protein [Triangularia verruculosa]